MKRNEMKKGQRLWAYGGFGRSSMETGNYPIDIWHEVVVLEIDSLYEVGHYGLEKAESNRPSFDRGVAVAKKLVNGSTVKWIPDAIDPRDLYPEPRR